LTCIPTGLPAVTGTNGLRVNSPQDKRIETYDLNDLGLARFFKTLTEDTCVLIEATITTFSFARCSEIG
jgi:hypothetical protein